MKSILDEVDYVLLAKVAVVMVIVSAVLVASISSWVEDNLVPEYQCIDNRIHEKYKNENFYRKTSRDCVPPEEIADEVK